MRLSKRNILIFILYLSICINNQIRLNSYLNMGIQVILILIIVYMLHRENINKFVILLKMIVITIPISFEPIVEGISISWFYIWIAIFNIYLFIENIKKKELSMISKVLIIQIIMLMITFVGTSNKIYGIKELITYLITTITLLQVFNQKIGIEDIEISKITDIYLIGCIFTSIAVIVQFIIYELSNKFILNGISVGGNRNIFMFLFSDSSFLSLYLATGAILYISTLNFKKINKEVVKKIIYLILIVIGIIATSARTGAMALGITMILYIFFKSKGRKKIVGLIVGLGGCFLLMCLVSTTREFNVNMFEGSGRIEGYIQGVEYFFRSPICGVGFDLGDIMMKNGQSIPHMSVLHFIAEIGIISTMIYIYIFYKMLRSNGRNEFKWMLIVTIIGSLFIPAIFESRFIVVIAILIIINQQKNKK